MNFVLSIEYNYIYLTQQTKRDMKTYEITFSLRDWKKGIELLQRFCLIKEGLTLSEIFHIKLEDWMHEELEMELIELDIEFQIELV